MELVIQSEFPFDVIRTIYGPTLAAILRKFDENDKHYPYANFITVLNTVLVWTGARNATYPPWKFCNKIDDIHNFINQLTNISKRSFLKIDELHILKRPQIYITKEITSSEFIIRRNSSQVRWAKDPPIGDYEIGKELDMYIPNIQHFATRRVHGNIAFCVYEVGKMALLYSEVSYLDRLTPIQLEEFIAYCEKRLTIWNNAMKKLDLIYRFIGTMNCKARPFFDMETTKEICGREFFGEKVRGDV